MEQRFSLITLCVRGARPSLSDPTGPASIRKAGVRSLLLPVRRGRSLALSAIELAKDADVSEHGEGFEGFTIAYNARSIEDVDTILAEIESAGGTIVKPSQAARVRNSSLMRLAP
jgi:hypothetical protein